MRCSCLISRHVLTHSFANTDRQWQIHAHTGGEIVRVVCVSRLLAVGLGGTMDRELEKYFDQLSTFLLAQVIHQHLLPAAKFAHGCPVS